MNKLQDFCQMLMDIPFYGPLNDECGELFEHTCEYAYDLASNGYEDESVVVYHWAIAQSEQSKKDAIQNNDERFISNPNHWET